jgi:hypothetical protein
VKQLRIFLPLLLLSCEQVPGEATIRHELASIRGATVSELRCAEHECTGLLQISTGKELEFSVDQRSFQQGGQLAIPRVGSLFPSFVECLSSKKSAGSFRLAGTLHIPSIGFIDASRGDTLQQLVDHYDALVLLVDSWPGTAAESRVQELDSGTRVLLWAEKAQRTPTDSEAICRLRMKQADS